MATATKKARAARPVARRARELPESAPLEFVIYQDNGGDYHWEFVGGAGEGLAQSGSFASYDDAERAAWRVHDGASSARFEPHVAKSASS